MVFVFAASRFGEEVVMLTCAGVSLIGVLVTLTCVSETASREERDGIETSVPMRVVISEPSLLDYFDAP